VLIGGGSDGQTSFLHESLNYIVLPYQDLCGDSQAKNDDNLPEISQTKLIF
jgi:hypothetical protein